MASLDCPKLRPLSGRRQRIEGREFVVLDDPAGVVGDQVLVPWDGFVQIVRHFDGQTSLREIQARILRETGRLVGAHELDAMVDQLDRAMVLDGPTFASFLDEYRRQRTRPAAHAGRSYPSAERALRAQLGQFFADPRGAGAPDLDGDASGPIRAVLSPHIDFGRGGPTYTWAYRELAEGSDAEIFVILGVAHQRTSRRFVLTRKDFETPLGLARTDRSFVDRLAALAGDQLFDDELVHRAEHSIEFQVVFLQYLLGGRRDFEIVPILVGTFQDLMGAGIDPIATPEVRRFVEALRAAESASGRRTAYIGGIDLGHIGPEFGDPEPVAPAIQGRLRAFDATMLERAAASDPAGWFATAAEVRNRWRICGLEATYTLLHAIGPTTGRLLRYDQAVDPQRNGCVSFASLAFQEPDAENAPLDG